MNSLNKDYWENRYNNNQVGWNIGSISTPLKTYFEQIENKELKILIPGAGNSYEAEYLWKNGFKNIYVLDFAHQPLDHFKSRIPEFPKSQLINSNFFELEDTFDLIIEQTFFCALNPRLRDDYVAQMLRLLKPKGKLVGLFFNFELTKEGPPFGGSTSEYQSRFKNNFNLKVLEPSINSIKEREGKELFFIFEKKS